MKAVLQKKRLIVLVPVGLLAALLSLALVWYIRIPKHNGRTVYYWLNEAVKAKTVWFENPKWKPVGAAFDAMGPAALPYIVEWLPDYDAGDPKLVQRAKRLLQKFGVPVMIYGPGIRPRTALVLLEYLGPKAAGAGERLAEILVDPPARPYNHDAQPYDSAEVPTTSFTQSAPWGLPLPTPVPFLFGYLNPGTRACAN